MRRADRSTAGLADQRDRYNDLTMPRKSAESIHPHFVEPSPAMEAERLNAFVANLASLRTRMDELRRYL